MNLEILIWLPFLEELEKSRIIIEEIFILHNEIINIIKGIIVVIGTITSWVLRSVLKDRSSRVFTKKTIKNLTALF
jgi:hypothetical protein